MNNGNWDTDYNLENLTWDERVRIDNDRRASEREAREARLGYITAPIISNEDIRAHFGRWSSDDEVSEHFGYMAPYQANRMMWICHNCGSFGFKTTLRETSKCYGWGCHSRNITVCRAGEISILLRGIRPGAPVGLNMETVFAARQERLRLQRAQRRTGNDVPNA